MLKQVRASGPKSSTFKTQKIFFTFQMYSCFLKRCKVSKAKLFRLTGGDEFSAECSAAESKPTWVVIPINSKF